MKYQPSDDGKTIDGKIVVFLQPGAAPPARTSPGPADMAKAQAASLTAAARDGVPFCEECEATRRELLRKLEESA
jgi:hypothetical protein